MVKFYGVSALIGIVLGVVTFIFGSILNLISKFIGLAFPYNLVLIPLVGIATVILRNKYKREVDQSMSQVFAATKADKELSPLIIPFQMFTTWLAHLSGASVGREGVAVQLGGVIANYAANLDQQLDRKVLTRIGMAAGFAGLFGTPLAASVFCFEVSRKKPLVIHQVIGTLIATYTASLFSTLLGLSHFHLENQFIKMTSRELILFVFCVILFVIVGHVFALALNKMKHINKAIKINDIYKIAALSVIGMLALFYFNDGRYMSLGTNIINEAFNSPETILVFDFGYKLLFTIFFVSIGFQGGEVTPLFAIGASLGVALSNILFLPTAIVGAIGYAFTFGNATNAYFTAMVLTVEIFGVSMLPYALLALAITLVIRNDSHTIYPNLEWE
ncbi:chloride channel protein [Mollicutes bacterium LVI A0039]|nr:chloride channel protein [Mollicutes bacterium LVI A0039]